MFAKKSDLESGQEVLETQIRYKHLFWSNLMNAESEGIKIALTDSFPYCLKSKQSTIFFIFMPFFCLLYHSC